MTQKVQQLLCFNHQSNYNYKIAIYLIKSAKKFVPVNKIETLVIFITA